jgi:DNA/RNA endonuclease G (NUC1)
LIALLALLPVLAAAETDAQFREGEKNRRESCPNVWEGMGVPSYLRPATIDATLVCHDRFVLSHNNRNRSPDWVGEHLRKEELPDKFGRPSIGFSQERSVRPSARAKDDDYPVRDLHIARGHMAPSEDFNGNEDDMKETFVLSNAIPQVAERFNGSIWKRLETEVRNAAIARERVFVISGPIQGLNGRRTRVLPASANACGHAFRLKGPPQRRACKANRSNPYVPCGVQGVLVPVGAYKIIYDPGRQVAYAFILPNIEHPSKEGDEALTYLNGFRATVAAVEFATGVQFLRGIPQDQQDKVIRTCADDSLWRAP